MTLCINCGVELDDGLKICPLCGRDPEKDSEQENLSSGNPSDIMSLHRKETRKYFWELSGVITFSGIVVCTIVDLITNKGLRWSLYPDVSVLAAWIILTLSLYTNKYPLLFVSGLMITILAALFIIDLISGGLDWFFPVGLPITLGAFIAAGIVMLLYKVVHLEGLNIIASGFIVLSGFCIITEMVLDKYLKGHVDLLWSLITAVSILPAALIFFFYHYRLKKGNRLDSFFHV
jgi:hypothetical protein